MPFFTFLAAIGEAIAGAVGSAAVAAGAGGTLAGALGTAAEFGIGGAVLGAGESALMGKNPLQGAEAGLIGGAVTGGLGGLLGSSLGSTAGGAVAGALGGGLGSLATGTNPLTGALTGGVGGGIAGSMGGLGGAAPGGAQSAVSALGPTYDPTQAFTTAGGLPNISGDLTQGVPSLGGTSGTIGPTTQLDALGKMASGLPVSAMGNAPVDTPSGGSIFSNLFGGNGAGAGDVGSPAVPGTMATGNINTPAPGLNGAASGGASGAAGAGGIKNLFSDPLGTIKANPGLALAGLGLGYDVLKGNQMPKGYAQLEQQANTLTAEANQLTQGALNNALPPEAQAQLDQAQNSAMQQIRSKYAQMGLSGSSMEAQAQAGVNEAMASQGYSIMQQLMSQGLSAAQAANAALAQIMNANVAQGAATSGAIGNFAGALAGSSTKKD